MTIRSTLAAALAVMAIAAPSASAIPGGDTTEVPAAYQQPQTLVVKSPGHPSEAGNTRPLPPLGDEVAESDDGLDWAMIGLGIAGTLLAMGGIVALTSRRPVPRTRISV